MMVVWYSTDRMKTGASMRRLASARAQGTVWFAFVVMVLVLMVGVLADGLRSSEAVLSHDALEVYVHRLRRRLQGSGAAIHTVRGLGYVLEPSDEAPE